MSKKSALGKGLSSLLPARSKQDDEEVQAARPKTALSLDEIRLNPSQPRRAFREQQLEELAESIRHDGVIQPLIVRNWQGGYQLVAGERRLRAAKLAGLDRVPVVVQDISDERMLELALVENIQREDLNPIELAQAFERLSNNLGLNHEEIGKRTGKDRATVSNAIRLLKLPADLQEFVASGKLSPGHARALLKLESDRQRNMALQCIAEEWTVRALEVASSKAQGPLPGKAREPVEPGMAASDPNLRSATDELERVLGTRVRISATKTGQGKIEIEYYNLEDLNRLFFYITRQD